MSEIFHPLVSIVIPVYNGSNYMREAIDSALAQAYDNIEILVVNDGSNDNGATDSIAKSYGDKIRYFQKENGGVATALNLAIKNMKGEYFSWLSHDDVYSPMKIALQIGLLQKNFDSKAVIYSNSEYADSTLKSIHKTAYEFREAASLLENPFYAALFGTISGCTLLIPKEILISNGMFDENLRYTQDYDFWFRMRNSCNLRFIQDVLVTTRIHSEQDYQKENHRQKEEITSLWSRMIASLDAETLKNFNLSKYATCKLLLDRFFYPQRSNLNHQDIIDYIEKIQSNYKNEHIDTKKYKVSIIIPFYNRINLTSKAIASALAQSHKNVEVIVINDYSEEDISPIRDLASTDTRVILLNNKMEKGCGNARNVGLDFASGDFAAFLDSDDLFDRDKITVQVQEMLKYGVDFSYTDYQRYTDNNKMLEVIECPSDGYISKCEEISFSTVMITRKIYYEKKFRLENTHTGEDICFFMKISREYHLHHVPQVLTKFYAGDNSAFLSPQRQIQGIVNVMYVMLNDLKLSTNLTYYKRYIDLLALNYAAGHGSTQNSYLDAFPFKYLLIRATKALYRRIKRRLSRILK